MRVCVYQNFALGQSWVISGISKVMLSMLPLLPLLLCRSACGKISAEILFDRVLVSSLCADTLHEWNLELREDASRSVESTSLGFMGPTSRQLWCPQTITVPWEWWLSLRKLLTCDRYCPHVEVTYMGQWCSVTMSLCLLRAFFLQKIPRLDLSDTKLLEPFTVSLVIFAWYHYSWYKVPNCMVWDWVDQF